MRGVNGAQTGSFVLPAVFRNRNVLRYVFETVFVRWIDAGLASGQREARFEHD